MEFKTRQFGVLLICVFFVVQFTSTTQAQSAVEKQKLYRRGGGWTMNSIGYNAGIDALQKMFGKRDMPADGDLAFSPEEDSIKSMVEEFVSFLELKESGLLGPALVRCLKAEMNMNSEK